jgi:hypothetical protein
MKPGSQVRFREIVNVSMVLCPAWSAKDWSAPSPGVHNSIVTITYPNGTVLRAIVLSHDKHAIRAAAAGCDDVLAFTRIHGTWISEEIEPVTIEFDWQRRRASQVCSEDDCVCPKELAARLSQTLFTGGERDEVVADTLYVFSPGGSRVAIHLTELQLM